MVTATTARGAAKRSLENRFRASGAPNFTAFWSPANDHYDEWAHVDREDWQPRLSEVYTSVTQTPRRKIDDALGPLGIAAERHFARLSRKKQDKIRVAEGVPTRKTDAVVDIVSEPNRSAPQSRVSRVDVLEALAPIVHLIEKEAAKWLETATVLGNISQRLMLVRVAEDLALGSAWRGLGEPMEKVFAELRYRHGLSEDDIALGLADLETAGFLRWVDHAWHPVYPDFG